jgi:tetratricopeptide (TPR) repeat protein
MRKRPSRLAQASLAALAAAALLFAAGCEKLRARDHLNKGVMQYKNAKYTEAVEHFRQAVELDPTFTVARLYLATAYMSQYIPGAESPENMEMAKRAFNEFQEVLKQDPKDQVATASIASLYYNQKKFPEAREWNQKLIAIKPDSKEAYYTLAVIAWLDWLTPDREARAQMKMQPEDPGPLKDKKVREELKAKYLPLLDEGIKNAEKALEIDKEYDDAMAYMNLLIRYRADLLDTKEEYLKACEVADGWVQKSLATKKMKAEKAAKPGASAETK